jgi:hypothetical protein
VKSPIPGKLAARMFCSGAADGLTEYGDVIVQAGLAVRHSEDSVFNKQSLYVNN